ncbi:DUF2085 domain-containing protein [bacterium]|nr:DUF2085 domain-containing protein [bacterium]
MMLNITLYSRKNCHLCEQARADLDSLQAEFPHRLVEIDIESDPALHKKYLEKIPVLEVGPFHKEAPFTRIELAVTLGAARDRQAALQKLAATASAAPLDAGDRFSLWMARNYLWVVLILFVFYVGLPVLAPVLMKAGYTTPARVIYTAYSPLCHQLGFRSFFLFGEQPFYPRAAANVSGAQTYAQATGQSEDDLLAARRFLGDEIVGYKIALCERDIAIYGAIVLFVILFGLSGRRIPPLHWALWLLIGLGPIGLDGFSQLFSQLNLPFLAQLLPFRESSPTLRIITGGLFGFTTAWFGIPYMEESMRETRDLLMKKFATLK